MKSGTFTRYLFSYIILLLIPVLVFTFIIYNYYIGFYTDTMIAQDVGAVEKIKNNIDLQIESLYGTVMQLSSENIFTTSYQTEKLSGFIEINSRLKSIEASNNFIDEVFFYNKSMDSVYASDAVYTFDSFYKYGSVYANYTRDEFKNLLNSVGKHYFWIPQQSVYYGKQNNTTITYIVPMNWSSINTYSMILFQINASSINKLTDKGDNIDNNVVITANDNLIIYNSGKELSDKTVKSLIGQMQDKKYINATIDGRKFLVSRSRSNSTGLTYYSITPTDTVLKELKGLSIIFVLGTLFILAVGSVFIKIFMNFNYNPIRRLSGIAKSLFPGAVGSRDDIFVTQNALIGLLNNSIATEKERHGLLREKLLLKLLNGNIENIESCNAQGAAVGIEFMGPCFLVAVLKAVPGQTGKAEDDQEIYEFIKSRMEPDLQSFLLTNLSDLIIIASGRELNNRQMKERFSGILDGLETRFDLRYSAGIGNFYHSITSVSQSYFEASLAARSGRANGYRNVALFDELSSPIEEVSYPDEEINSLYHAVKSGDTEKISWLMKVLAQTVNLSGNNTLKICIFKDIIRMSDAALKDLNCTFPEIFPEIKGKYEKILYSAELDANAISDLLYSLSQDLLEYVGANLSSSESTMDKILAYINTHYMDVDFSVCSLSEQFAMSLSNFSHYFKSRMGQNVSDYINLIKFEKTKELLRNTAVPIQEIAGQAGYVQVSSFMRKFKSMEGLTPGEYRSKFKSSEAKTGEGTSRTPL